MHVTMLGTGAPLMPDRCTMGMVVTAAGCQPLLIDTCGGFELARQLVKAGFQLNQIRNVVVTHRHLDHTGGLQALCLATIPLDVYASRDCHDGLAALNAATFPEWQRHPEMANHVVAGGETREIGGFEVTFHDVDHRVPTLAVRVAHGGRVFAFSADCLPCDGAIAAAKDADLFLCDAMTSQADGEIAVKWCHERKHPTAAEAARMAVAAGARSLALTHIGRRGTPALILEEAAAIFDGPVSIPHDLARLSV